MRLIKSNCRNIYSFVAALSLILLLSYGCASPKQENKISEPAQNTQTQTFSKAKVKSIAQQRMLASGYLQIQTKNIKANRSLAQTYHANNYSLLWINSNGASPQALEMIEVVRTSGNDALNPMDYHIEEIEAALIRIDGSNKSIDEIDLAELELLLSNAFLNYARDVHYGRVNPGQINLELLSSERPINISELLTTSTANNQVKKTLDGLMPKYPVYAQLRDGLQEYREIAENGGWQRVPYGDKFKKGARGTRVVALRERLIVTGELESSVPVSDVFDETLDQAVRKYQSRNGLYVDGVVGKSTIEALNVPVEQRISQIELSMERWRILPQYLGSRYILVNIANFHLYGVDNNNDVVDMRIVVGKPEWNTPMFSEEMTHIVMNPYWNIPPSIFKDDIAPRIKSDPEYLSKRGIDALGLKAPEKLPVEETQQVEVAENVEIIETDEDIERPLSEAEIQNQQAQQEYISQVLSGKYRLRQNPGPGNPLGQIKFLFPNKHAVYLHDTPNRGFFKRAQRNFSHGCIRVERPIDLAEFVLASNLDWNQSRVKSSINSRKTRTVHLNQTIPVYILYFTSWVDDAGNVNFHKDIYGEDQALLNALRASRPNFDMATTVQ
ncbi:MAG: L,D-transpeptidase family protein [Thermodesulfobacteriota bacterium]